MFVMLTARMHGILRYSTRDVVLIMLSLVYAGLLAGVPSIPLMAIGLWWTANTVAHNFIHTPFFRSRALNRLYGIYLSALMGFPQELWRGRHLRHHRGDQRPVRLTTEGLVQCGVVLAMWSVVAVASPGFFATIYLPGYLLGLSLCALQGHFEHADGTTSHYGWLYNRVFFNDGYHVEHHRRPGVHWTRLPLERARDARTSRWPPVLRWLDTPMLEFLERIALRSPWIQRYVLHAHERAFRALLPSLPGTQRITIVGGGLFPRTALILRKLQPHANLMIVDARRDHLDVARSFLSEPVELCEHFFDPRLDDGGDLIVIPLSFIGSRDAIYQAPPARAALVHDWLWNVRGRGVRVSWLLLKRLNLVTR
jgi:fatty acid desaturase